MVGGMFKNEPDEFGSRLDKSSCFCSCCCGFDESRTPTARHDCTCKRRYCREDYEHVEDLAKLVEFLGRRDLADALRVASEAAHAHAKLILR